MVVPKTGTVAVTGRNCHKNRNQFALIVREEPHQLSPLASQLSFAPPTWALALSYGRWGCGAKVGADATFAGRGSGCNNTKTSFFPNVFKGESRCSKGGAKKFHVRVKVGAQKLAKVDFFFWCSHPMSVSFFGESQPPG